MRIGNNTMVERALRDLTANKVRVANVQRDITTGKRLHRGSDDPTAAARMHALREQITINETYRGNVEAAREFMLQTDSALSSYGDALIKLRSLALQGSGGHLQQSEKAILANQARDLREVIRAIGNTQDPMGRYIFGGLKTQTEPFPSDVTLGPADAGLMDVEVAQGARMTYNVTGVEAFGDVSVVLPPPDVAPHVFAEIDELIGFLEAGTNNRDITDISLAKIDARIETLTGLRAEVGSRIQRADLARERYEELKMQLDGMLEEVESTDIAQASLRLNQYEAAFRASLAVGARALPPSLVDFLR